MFALIDCNNFFVSCERVVNPSLWGKPVVVTSSNEGCAVALSNEAKALGIKRGVPIFQIRDLIRANSVVVLPGRHDLYGKLSSQVMEVVESIVGNIEIYSIDEAFFQFEGYDLDLQLAIAHEVVDKVRTSVGIPTSIGIAPTRTLAKLAVSEAKKNPQCNSVHALSTPEQWLNIMKHTPIGDVWGIGRRLREQMKLYGIATAFDFASLSPDIVKRMMNVPGRRTWQELNGTPCIEPDPDRINNVRKQISATRTLVPSVTDIADLRGFLSELTEKVARKLRRQNGFAANISVFIQTNQYRTDLKQYEALKSIQFEEAINDTMQLTAAALKCLDMIYCPGLLYRRVGVFLPEILNAESVKQSLFLSPETREKRRKIMELYDAINDNPRTSNKLKLATTPSRPRRPNT